MAQIRFDPALENMRKGTEKLAVKRYNDRPIAVNHRRGFSQGEYKIVVVIPAYNEEQSIGSVLQKLAIFTDTVIVVDDGSTDATVQVAEDAGAIVFTHKKNLGKGAALNTAFRMAREHDPDVVVMLDADGQHLPGELPLVVSPLLSGQADIVIGSRYLGVKSTVPLHRILGHRVINLFTRLLTGVPSSDSQSGYRAFSPKAFQAFSFHSSGFAVESEMQFIAREQRLRMAESSITVNYQDRSKRSVIAHGLEVLKGLLSLTALYRPMLYFRMIVISSCTFGLLCSVVFIETFRPFMQWVKNHTLYGMLFIGTIFLSSGYILHSVRSLFPNPFKHNGKRPSNSISSR